MTEIENILGLLMSVPDQAAALATLVSVQGSSYRRPGARSLLLEDGRKAGSISGGCLEEDVSFRMRKVLQTGESDLVTYDTRNENDLVWGHGVGCQGVVRVLIEPISVPRPEWVTTLARNLDAGCGTNLVVGFSGFAAGRWCTHRTGNPDDARGGGFRERVEPSPRLILFGAGDDAIPLARIAQLVGWRVTVVDSRGSFAKTERFPDGTEVIVSPAERVDEYVELDSCSFVVLMTHRYHEDLDLLRILLGRPISYLGLLGSRTRTERILEQLRQEGVPIDPETLGRLYAPVGLDIGATTPEAIALSILAEMQCCITGRVAKSLRERTDAIHA